MTFLNFFIFENQLIFCDFVQKIFWQLLYLTSKLWSPTLSHVSAVVFLQQPTSHMILEKDFILDNSYVYGYKKENSEGVFTDFFFFLLCFEHFFFLTKFHRWEKRTET